MRDILTRELDTLFARLREDAQAELDRRLSDTDPDDIRAYDVMVSVVADKIEQTEVNRARAELRNL